VKVERRSQRGCEGSSEADEIGEGEEKVREK